MSNEIELSAADVFKTVQFKINHIKKLVGIYIQLENSEYFLEISPDIAKGLIEQMQQALNELEVGAN